MSSKSVNAFKDKLKVYIIISTYFFLSIDIIYAFNVYNHIVLILVLFHFEISLITYIYCRKIFDLWAFILKVSL